MGETIHSRKIKVNGCDIHYVTAGKGDPVIVIHGGAGGARGWMKNLIDLANNYTVYVPDLPGFGRSQPLEGDYYIPELVEFVDEFSQNMGLKEFHLIGHSLGGAVALSYALKFPNKITKLVLISSMSLGKEIALWVRVLSHSSLTSLIGAAVIGILKNVKWLTERLFAGAEFVLPISRTSMLIGCRMTTLKEQAEVMINRLTEIIVPTLVVWGANDPIVPAKQAYAAAKLIPTCQVEVFKDCGHSVYRERIPEFSRLLTGFLG